MGRLRIDRYDIIIIASIAIKMLTVFFTAASVFLMSDYTGATIESTVRAIEGNPLMHSMLNMQYIGIVLIMVSTSGLIFGFYFALRKYLELKIKERAEFEIVMDFLVITIFLITLANMMNDMGAVVGLILRS